MKSLFTNGKWIYLLVILSLGILVVYPMAIIVYKSFEGETGLTLRHYLNIFTDVGVYRILWNSFFVSIMATIIATIIGTFLAWFIARTDIPFKKWVKIGILIPFLIPPFIAAISWQQLLGPVGYFNKFYMYVTGATSPLFTIYGPLGIILVMTLSSFPLVYLVTVGAFEKMESALEEAGRMAGANKWRVLKDITLPIMLPTILAGAVLVFVTEISNFGVPAILGFQVSYFVLTTKIYDVLHSFNMANSFAIAAALSMLLVQIAAIGLWIQHIILNKKNYSVITGKSGQKMTISLGKARGWLTACILLLLAVTSLAPMLAIFLTSITKAYGLLPTWSNLTLDNYRYILLEMPMVKRAFMNSFILAFGAATIAVGMGVIIAYLTTKTKVPGRHVIDFIATLPYALPGTVVALSVILAWIRPIPIIDFQLYNTIWIILIAYIARYITFAVRTTSASLMQVHDSLEEAARISGASWLRNLKDIVLPLISPGIFAGWFLIFMPTLRELTISILLWSAGNETIAIAVFNLQESGDMTSASALSMIMILFVVVGHQLSMKLTKKESAF
ncbi:iron ABC transporter permease [Alkalihalobacillus sp. BA299]|uniref:ABC transporter permease n=1 Tax=Alkalihalobacillus sp. BA299 TaxID=2815938 RepID=UPI001AD9A540|nr:iron ABC transporter permease [Alkalihalobacillus sp. BA299]